LNSIIEEGVVLTIQLIFDLEKWLNQYFHAKAVLKNRQLLTSVIITVILASIVIVLQIIKFSEPHISMLLGMGLGISTSPLMMTWIKQVRTRRRVNLMLKELVQIRKNQEMTRVEDTMSEIIPNN